jgi:WD40 repeat protein
MVRGQLLFLTMFLAAVANTALTFADEESGLPVATLNRETPVSFAGEIQPVLAKKCLACHSASVAEGGVILESRQSMLESEASSGVLVEGQAQESLLFLAAAHRADSVMPPPENKVNAAPLTPDELALLKLWIDQGAQETGEDSNATEVTWKALPSQWQPAYAATISANGQVAACGRANRLFAYHLPSGTTIDELVDSGLQARSPYGDRGAAHLDVVQSLALSPDGQWLASGGYQEVKLWRHVPAVRREIADLPARATSCAVSDDGRLLAVGNSQLLYVVGLGALSEDASSGNTCIELNVSHVALSPDGSRLALATPDGQVVFRDLAENREVSQLPTEGPVLGLAVPDANTIVAWIGPRTLKAWRYAGGRLGDGDAAIAREWSDLNADVSSISARNGLLVVGFADGALKAWKVEDGAEVGSFSHGSPITVVGVITHDPPRFVSLGQDKSVRIWGAGKSDPLAILRGGEQAASEAARVARLASGAERRREYREKKLADARQQHADSLKKLEEARPKKKAADKEFAEKEAQQKEAVAKNEAAAVVLKAAEERAQADATDEAKMAVETAKAELANAEKAAKESQDALSKATKQRDEAARTVSDLELDVARFQGEIEAAEKALADATAEHDSLARDAQSRREGLDSIPGKFSMLAVSPDGRWLAAYDGESIQCYSTTDGRFLNSVPCQNADMTGLSITNAGAMVVVRSDGTAWSESGWGTWHWERTLGTPQTTFDDRVTALRFSPDGSLLAAGGGEPSRGGQIHLWAIPSGELVREIPEPHSDTVLALAFSPDGSVLASGGSDRLLKTFDVSTGELLKAFEGHTHHVLGCAWRFDRRVLLSASADGTLKTWDFDSGEQGRTMQVSEKEVVGVHFLADGVQSLSVGGDADLRVHNTDNGNQDRNLDRASGFLYSSDVDFEGKIAVASGRDGVLRVWDLESGKQVQAFEPPPRAADIPAQASR